jgi:hypothetical protein
MGRIRSTLRFERLRAGLISINFDVVHEFERIIGIRTHLSSVSNERQLQVKRIGARRSSPP